MNTKSKLLRLIAFCIVPAMLFVACGGKETPVEEPVETATPTPEVKAEATVPPAPVTETKTEEESGIKVDSVEKLLEEIKPGAEIVIIPGNYDLEIEKLWEEQGEAFNDKHEYVKIRDVFDGAELVITNVEGLKIRGGSDSFGDTKIVVNPRYAAVLAFEKCKDIKIENMTVGHTETGTCTGNVLDFFGCKNVEINNMDIYGCGVFGLGLFRGCSDITVNNSTIRDCYYGPFEYREGKGALTFNDSKLIDSGAYNYDATSESSVILNKCTLGDKETTCADSRGDIELNDCTLGEVEPYYYPDLDDGFDYNFDPSTLDLKKMSEVPIDDYITDRSWTGYIIKNTKTGETTYLPFYDDNVDILMASYCEFYYDNDYYDYKHYWINLNDELLEGRWYETSLWGGALLHNPDDDEPYAYIGVYKDTSKEDAHPWLCVSFDDFEVWYY